MPNAIHVRLDIAGCAVRLVCRDERLGRKARACFAAAQPLRRNRCFFRALPHRAFITLEVHSRASARRAGLRVVAAPGGSRQALQFLDGADEYSALFDFNSCRGKAVLTGSAPMPALANLLRRIAGGAFIGRRGAVFHCACVVRPEGACLLFGKSGAGKSTACTLSGGDFIASDDLTFVRMLGRKVLAWGLPAWDAAAAAPRRLSNGPFRVAAAFKLVKDRRIYAKPLAPAEAVAALLVFPSDLRDAGQAGKIVDLVAGMVHNIPCLELHFRKDRAFWDEIDARYQQ